MAIRYLTNLFLIIFFIMVFSCNDHNNAPLDAGISLSLARDRKANISNIAYQLFLNIPSRKEDAIIGEIIIDFNLSEIEDVILDFNADPAQVKQVDVNGGKIHPRITSEHIVIKSDYLKKNGNTIAINFEAGDKSLNRRDDYLYTLFVPERASTCFPVFDQPDLKATYELELTIPSSWKAVANSPVQSEKQQGIKTIYHFKKTPVISSYLFSFAVGDFTVVSREIDGQAMHMYHRETDSVKLADNIEEIFEWHKKSLDWLEEYTGIPYPFEKFDFVLIPSFQYGGMEHPGAILYKSESLLLDKSSTLNQKLGRARLIAHETSHMWFGDLVTMRWFGDVWLKEVFANFMAAKIVNPGYPDINHDLQFLMAHYPSAYDIDRTRGTHPIQQPLANLKNAGSLYGSIIYHKAPVVIHMLEDAIGEEELRRGIQSYLKNYAFKNAGWDDLIKILEANASFDLKKWNKIWVKGSGMPTIYYNIRSKNKKTVDKFNLSSRINNAGRPKSCSQDLEILLGDKDSSYTILAPLLTKPKEFSLKGIPNPDYLFTNGGGLGYGYFWLGRQSKPYFLSYMDSLSDPVLRGAMWIDMYESMLRKALAPEKLMNRAVKSLLHEDETLIAEYLTAIIKSIYWKFYTVKQREALAPKLEGILLNMAVSTTSQNLKSTYFNTLVSVAISKNGIELLRNFWSKEMDVEGLQLSERDFTRLAYELAVREVKDYGQILNDQLMAINNPDRKDKFKFVMQALSLDQTKRDSFFKSLESQKNRENEDWVLTALSYLHHPLRAQSSLKYIRPSLEMLQDIQLTGDIFFPKGWLEATLEGHTSEQAAEEVKQFLYGHNKYPLHLKNKILQSADLLFRTVEVKEKFDQTADHS